VRSGFAFVTAGAVVLLAATTAWAGHGKVGLWNVSVTVKMSQFDTSKMNPRAVAQLKAMGMLGGKGMVVNDQRCMTAAEVASSTFNPRASHDNECKPVNVKSDGGHMSGDVVCTGKMNATGHMAFNFDRDTHYSGHMTMKGTREGHPVDEDITFEGNWVKADCGGVK